MPKRTNQFQELVALIQRSLVPTGAIVVESAEVLAGGVMREIDVLVTADVGISKVKIAVEAKDHKRKLSVTDIEALIGKYRSPDGIPVNQVILVARRGFSATARQRAKLVGMRLFTLAEASETDWPTTIYSQKNAPATFRVAPHVAGIEIEPRPSAENAEHLSTSLVECASCGMKVGKLKEYCTHLVKCLMPKQTSTQITSAFDHAFKRGQQGTICMKVNFDLKNKCLLCQGEKLPLDRATVHIHARNEKSAMEFKYFDYLSDDGEKHQIHHGKACFNDSTFEILLPDGTKSKSITVKVSGDC